MARNPSAKPNPARIADEQHRLFEMKRTGMSVRAIANETGIPRSTVENRLKAAYAELVLPLAEEVRKLDLERLDAWLKRLEDRLEQGEDPIRVVPIALKVLERRSKLTGADAPERAEMTVHQITAEDVELIELANEARVRLVLEEAALRNDGM